MGPKVFARTVACAALGAIAAPALAADTDQELVYKLNNPISDLVSVPFQFNWEFGEGPNNDMWQITNVQPVVPFHITPNTNMIARLIMPTISTPGQTVSGDMTFSLFFSPQRSTGTIWGLGPAMVIPRTGPKWGLGPTLVVLKQAGTRTFGVLANQIWSFAGDEKAADLNQAFIQPFFAVATANAMTYTIQSETQVNWDAASGDQWSIPLNFIVAKLARAAMKKSTADLIVIAAATARPGREVDAALEIIDETT